MKKTKSIYLALLAVLLSPMAANADPILIVEGGQVTGATGVDVGGTLYDIAFSSGSDGNCVVQYTGCNDESDFTFDLAGGLLAMQALFDQVLIDTVDGSFDTQPGLVNTCSPFSCQFLIPVWNAGSVFVVFRTNLDTVIDFSVNSGAFTGSCFANNCPSSTQFVSWSPATTVPEPSTLALFGIGLLGMGAARRRKKA